jgi:transposase
MPKPYSSDLRERVLRACARGKLSRAKIAVMFQVAESTLYRWLETWRSEGRREAKPHAGGPEPRLDAAALDELKAIVAEVNDLSLAEYATKLQERAGVTASGPTVSRALKKLGLPRKKAPLSTNALVGFRGGRSGQATRNVGGCGRLRELSLTARWCP